MRCARMVWITSGSVTAILALFVFTLGRRKLTEREGRILKLVSGTMMLGLGALLLINPALLSHIGVTGALLTGALLVSALIIRLSLAAEASV